MKKSMKAKKINKLNKILIILAIPLLAVVITISLMALVKANRVEVRLKNDLTVEVNSDVNASYFIDDIINASLDKDEKIDTSTLGGKEVNIKLKHKNKTEDYKFSIKVVDTTPPEITTEEVITTKLKTKVDLLKGVSAIDNSNEKIEVTVNGSYNLNKAGKYELIFAAEDSSQNKSEKKVTLNVVDPNNYTFTTSKGFKGEVKNGVTYIEGTLIANKSYKLPSTYGDGLTSELNSAFDTMNKEANKAGYNLHIESGFRSYSFQKTVYNNWVRIDGKEEADTYSARPGYSEHQSGLAIDINDITEAFGDTPTGKWVHNNCYKYGFIIRYPKGKDNITGYVYEPWHLRYVGKELASKLYNKGDWITLEEYFGIDSKYS